VKRNLPTAAGILLVGLTRLHRESPTAISTFGLAYAGETEGISVLRVRTLGPRHVFGLVVIPGLPRFSRRNLESSVFRSSGNDTCKKQCRAN
jgi:hypothetical protein